MSISGNSTNGAGWENTVLPLLTFKSVLTLQNPDLISSGWEERRFPVVPISYPYSSKLFPQLVTIIVPSS